MSEQKMLFLYCEENLHVGAGSSTGTIDLPIQRESHTSFPKIEGSSFRGGIRESINDSIDAIQVTKFENVFGKRNSGDQQSAIDFPDAKLLLFPVRSYKGIFAWITCPFVLHRFKKDYKNWLKMDLGFIVPSVENDEIIVQTNSLINVNDQVLLEEFLFAKRQDIPTPAIDGSELGAWIAQQFVGGHAIINQFSQKLAIVSDEVFADFVKLYTVKMTRNSIDPKTGTAKGTALFNEEFLPSESLLYSFALTSNEFKANGMDSNEVMQFFTDSFPPLFRLGGDKSIGKGLVRQQLIDAIPTATPAENITSENVSTNQN